MRIIGCFLTLLIGWPSWAQVGQWTVGLRAGVGLAGSNRFVQLDPELSDHYHRGLALSAGVHLRYRLGSRLALAAGADVQRLKDSRRRLFTPVEQFTSDYTNQLTQVQLPVYIQWTPVPAWKKVYVLAGAGPKFLLHGATQFTTVSGRLGPLSGGSLVIPLHSAANRHLQIDWVWMGGAGLAISKRLAFAISHHYSKPIAYTPFDPGNLTINPPTYFTRASQSWLFTTVYWLR